MSALLALREVGLELGGREVLRGVTLELAAGEVVGVLGPNGAGKTSLLRVAAGLAAPSRGRVELQGDALSRLPRRELARRLAVVSQDTGVPFPYTVGELVLLGRVPHRPWLALDAPRDVTRAHRALARLGIEALADRSVLELSGGERQLVHVARALAQESPVLLLDEPTAFLDLRHRIEVLEVVRERARAGGAALVVSHDLGLAARACDRLVLLAEGRRVASGPASEVLKPELLQRAFGIASDVVEAPDGTRVVVPRLSGAGPISAADSSSTPSQ